jgi:hypothetical protein
MTSKEQEPRTCQRGDVECGKPGTHALVLDTGDTGVRMCGPHAVQSVTEFMAQGEKDVWAVKVGGGS